MTRSDLIEELAAASGFAKSEAEKLVETIFQRMAVAMVTADKVEIRGFGSFHIRRRRPRLGHNPRSGTMVDVPAKRVSHFKPGKAIRAVLNGADQERPFGRPRTSVRVMP